MHCILLITCNSVEILINMREGGILGPFRVPLIIWVTMPLLAVTPPKDHQQNLLIMHN